MPWAAVVASSAWWQPPPCYGWDAVARHSAASWVNRGLFYSRAQHHHRCSCRHLVVPWSMLRVTAWQAYWLRNSIKLQ